MSSALTRCYTENNGVKGLTFVPATNEEVAEVMSLGDDAIAPLASYVDAKLNADFTQLFAVRFLADQTAPAHFLHSYGPSGVIIGTLQERSP